MEPKKAAGLPNEFTKGGSQFSRELFATSTTEEPQDTFILHDGEKKVTQREEIIGSSNDADPTPLHATVFTFNREDHTLGNLLTTRLRLNPFVDFCAYKVPHPHYACFDLRVHIIPGRFIDNRAYTAQDAVEEACTEIISDLTILSSRAQREFILANAVRGESEPSVPIDWSKKAPEDPTFGGLAIPKKHMRREYRGRVSAASARFKRSTPMFEDDYGGRTPAYEASEEMGSPWASSSISGRYTNQTDAAYSESFPEIQIGDIEGMEANSPDMGSYDSDEGMDRAMSNIAKILEDDHEGMEIEDA